MTRIFILIEVFQKFKEENLHFKEEKNRLKHTELLDVNDAIII